MTPRDWLVAIIAVALFVIIQSICEYAVRLVELWRDPGEPEPHGLLQGQVTVDLTLDPAGFQSGPYPAYDGPEPGSELIEVTALGEAEPRYVAGHSGPLPGHCGCTGVRHTRPCPDAGRFR